MLEAGADMDSNGDWITNSVNSTLQTGLTGRHPSMSSSVSHSLAGVEPAALVPSNIWISCSLYPVPSSVPGRVHHASLTGSRSTVNKLLLTQGEKTSTVILFPASLQRSS